MHWLESGGCCKAVVIENLVVVFVWVLRRNILAVFVFEKI